MVPQNTSEDSTNAPQRDATRGAFIESPIVIPIADKVDYARPDPYGDGECVAFPKALAEQNGISLGQAKYNWWAGANVMEHLDTIRMGTVIISGYDRNGKYRSLDKGNHAAIFIKPSADRKGFWVWEQIGGTIQPREVRNSNGGYFSNPYRYAVLAVITPGRGSGRR